LSSRIRSPGPLLLGGAFLLATACTAEERSSRVAIAGLPALASWLSIDTIAYPGDRPGTSFELRYAVGGAAPVDGSAFAATTVVSLQLDPGGLPADLRARHPHLARHRRLLLNPDDVPDPLEQLITGQLLLVARDAQGAVVQRSRVQLAGLLDQQFAHDGELGVTFADDRQATFRLWAPTARSVSLHIHDAHTAAEIATVVMGRGDRGVWTYTGPDTAGWYGQYYRYTVELFLAAGDGGQVVHNLVTDPYSVSLSSDSRFSQLISLDDPLTMPPGWKQLIKHRLEAPEEIVLYELHIRDATAADATIAAAHRGKYAAFTYDGSTPERPLSAAMRHLRELQRAGVTHLHLLPAFDFASVAEDTEQRVDLGDTVMRLCARNREVPAALCAREGPRRLDELLGVQDRTTPAIQQLVNHLRQFDSYNWGYDPFHFGVPEGSYAVAPDGAARIREFRAMVAALAASGLRLTLDVVYNHTAAAGQNDRSLLDRIVPGYYHRRHPISGDIERSTCCANTASENHMMRKLMIDTLVRWARDYKVDAFRFDLMGHHMKADMLEARTRLAALTIAADGVDGPGIYLYGEGWDFGEVAGNARGVNASQRNMAGTGIGTFNDRLRDGVRGGHPSDDGVALRRNQGFASGAFHDRNELGKEASEARAEAIHQADLIRAGLAGNLRDFVLVNGTGRAVTAADLDYGGAPAGYTADPEENVLYVSSHDDHTLWDINTYKLPTGTPTAARVRAQVLAASIALLGQGVPFFDLGIDLLRSRSMDSNSHDSGDWFNAVDFTHASNGWNAGLPRHEEEAANYELIQQLLADRSIAPGRGHIAAASTAFREHLHIRRSTPLFRLRTAEQVKRRVDFHNTGPAQLPGLIVMTISDGRCAGADLDPALDGIVVLFNATGHTVQFRLPFTAELVLHPVQRDAADPLTSGSTAAGDQLTISPRTTAVFVAPQRGAQGNGIPCNTRTPTALD
jgi:pullulanase-type alpha-1,6-glucosidase